MEKIYPVQSKIIVIIIMISCSMDFTFAQTKSENDSTLQVLTLQAERLKQFAKSDLGISFLEQTGSIIPAFDLPRIYYNRQVNTAYTESDFEQLEDSLKEDFTKLSPDIHFYYFTRYGTPLAYIAPLEIIGTHLQDSNTKLKILDFGFGSIGHLELLRLNDHSVSGIEIDPVLEILYQKADQRDDQLTLHYGSFPKDPNLVSEIGTGYDLFISKNTLKRGYVNPPFEVDKRFSLNLGVTDQEFLNAVYSALKPGGYFLIYNLHGEISFEKNNYKPWADGRSPYNQDQYEETGFTVVSFDADHTYFARRMGASFGWDNQMNFETDLFGTYTLLKKEYY